MLPTITKIYNRSDFTIQLPLAEGYDGQEFRFTIYTCGEIENGWVASYIDGVYTNCSVENDIVIIYVNNNNQMNPGCVTVQSEYDYFNSHFIDNEDNVKDVYKTNIYLVSYKTNAFSAQFRPSNLPDLTGSSEYVTLSYLTTTLEDYVTDEELQSQLEDFVTEEDFAAELSNYVTESQLQSTLTAYITDEELTDMGFVTQSDIDQMSYATVAYLNEKLSSKQNLLVSGQNIKTINGYSLLGSGNLVIEGGGGAIDLSSYVTYDFLSSQSYVSQTQLSANSYVTSSDISDFVTEQDVQNILVEGGYVTQDELQLQLSTAAYITSNELSQMSYINTQYLDEASYMSFNELSQMSYVTNTSLQSQLQQAGYVTQSQLSANSYLTENDFKTINGYSLIGEGNIVISGGGSIDLSAYVTKDELSAAGYVTDTALQSQLQQAGYLTSIPSEYVTESELNSMSYVSHSELSSMGYITINDVPVVDLSSYVTYTYLESQGFVTTSDLIDELGDYPTNNDLALTLQDYISYSQFNTYTSDFVVDSDLENFITYDYLEGQGYITSIPNNYATYDAISQMGYITLNDVPVVDLSSYVTKSQLSQELNSYVTKTELSNAGYVTNTSLQSQLQQAGYITSSALSGLATEAYVTNAINDIVVPTKTSDLTNDSGFITSSALSGLATEQYVDNAVGAITVPTKTSDLTNDSGFITASALNGLATETYVTNAIADIDLPVIDENLIPNTTNTYTLGDSTHFYANTYMSDIWLGAKNKFSNKSDYQVNLMLNNNWRYSFHSNGFSPAINNTQRLGQPDSQWSYTYSANFIEDGTNIKDIYTQAYVLTQNQYDGLSQADKDKETIYIISDQQAYMNNELVTETSLDSRGFLTAANFNYDPTTGTLTLNL